MTRSHILMADSVRQFAERFRRVMQCYHCLKQKTQQIFYKNDSGKIMPMIYSFKSVSTNP